MAETREPIAFTPRSLLVLTVAGAVLCSLGVCFIRYVRSTAPADATGPVTDRAKWPYGLQEFIRYGLPEEVDIEPVKVYCWGRLIDQEHAWQHKATPELFETMIEWFDLKPIDCESQDAQVLRQRVPPSWCKPSHVGKAEFFARQPWVNGHDGSRYVVMYDKDRQIVTVWNLFVF